MTSLNEMRKYQPVVKTFHQWSDVIVGLKCPGYEYIHSHAHSDRQRLNSDHNKQAKLSLSPTIQATTYPQQSTIKQLQAQDERMFLLASNRLDKRTTNGWTKTYFDLCDSINGDLRDFDFHQLKEGSANKNVVSEMRKSILKYFKISYEESKRLVQLNATERRQHHEIIYSIGEWHTRYEKEKKRRQSQQMDEHEREVGDDPGKDPGDEPPSSDEEEPSSEEEEPSLEEESEDEKEKKKRGKKAVFAQSPGMANRFKLLNFKTAATIKFYTKATKELLPELYDCEPDRMYAFLKALKRK